MSWNLVDFNGRAPHKVGDRQPVVAFLGSQRPSGDFRLDRLSSIFRAVPGAGDSSARAIPTSRDFAIILSCLPCSLAVLLREGTIALHTPHFFCPRCVLSRQLCCRKTGSKQDQLSLPHRGFVRSLSLTKPLCTSSHHELRGLWDSLVPLLSCTSAMGSDLCDLDYSTTVSLLFFVFSPR